MMKKSSFLTWRMNKMDEKTYLEQQCGFCKGTGKNEGEECPACSGKATFMVKEPPKVCQFCKGNGYTVKGVLCRTCKGTGWMGVKRN